MLLPLSSLLLITLSGEYVCLIRSVHGLVWPSSPQYNLSPMAMPLSRGHIGGLYNFPILGFMYKFLFDSSIIGLRTVIPNSCNLF